MADDITDRLEDELQDSYNLSGLENVKLAAADVCPSSVAPVLVGAKDSAGGNAGDSEKPGILVKEMTWGFLPYQGTGLMINARAETAATKPSFSDALVNHRCLIPASGFYEWDKDKNKAEFRLANRRLLYLCGLYQLSGNAERFVILTTAANESMIRVHDRMPLFVGGEGLFQWLGESNYQELLTSPMPLLECKKEYDQMRLF